MTAKKKRIDGAHDKLSPFPLRAALECAIVVSICAVVIFIIIPTQTISQGEIGLSPGLLPTVCAAAIGALAVIQFIATFISKSSSKVDPQPSMRYVFTLVAAALVGVVCIAAIGWVIGAAVLSLLVLLALGERGITRLILVPALVSLALFFIGKLGI
jgi:hypothetical protein